jgi:hypothetical protein
MGFPFLTGYVLGQHGRQSARLAMASSGSSVSLEDILDVNERVDRLTLVVEAMWSLLEESGYTAEQLEARIAELDGADGTVDGKRTKQVGICRECGSKVAPGLPACQICGGDVAGYTPDPFAGV